MDPFSATASAITVLAAAGKASLSLYEFFHGIRTAREEIQGYCALLERLTHTFMGLQALQSQQKFPFELSNDFSARVNLCLEDMQSLQNRLHTFRTEVGENQTHRNLKKLKWQLSSQKWLTVFFARLQLYHADFALELSCAQLKSQSALYNLLSHTSQNSKLDTQPSEHTTLNLDLGTAKNTNQPVWPEVAERTKTYTSEQSYHYQKSIYSMIVRTGSTYIRDWYPLITNSTCTEFVASGRSVKFNLNIPLLSSAFIEVALYIYIKTAGKLSFSNRFSLTCARVVSDCAPIVQYASVGDIAAMEDLFREGKASPCDVLADGISLLHIATSRDNLDLVQFLVSRGADVESMDADGDTPIHIAIARGKNYNIVRALLEEGSDIGTCNFAGQTPIHHYPNQVLRQVISAYDGPMDPFMQDHDGMTILHYLSHSKNTVPKELHRVVGNQYRSLTVKNALGDCPLHYALKRGNVALGLYIVAPENALPYGSTTDASCAALLCAAFESNCPKTIDLVTRFCNDRSASSCGAQLLLHRTSLQSGLPNIEKNVQLDAGSSAHVAAHYSATNIVSLSEQTSTRGESSGPDAQLHISHPLPFSILPDTEPSSSKGQIGELRPRASIYEQLVSVRRTAVLFYRSQTILFIIIFVIVLYFCLDTWQNRITESPKSQIPPI